LADRVGSWLAASYAEVGFVTATAGAEESTTKLWELREPLQLEAAASQTRRFTV
jgi:hypothetical protein